jgi:hypothetical protein
VGKCVLPRGYNPIEVNKYIDIISRIRAAGNPHGIDEEMLYPGKM